MAHVGPEVEVAELPADRQLILVGVDEVVLREILDDSLVHFGHTLGHRVPVVFHLFLLFFFVGFELLQVGGVLGRESGVLFFPVVDGLEQILEVFLVEEMDED